MISQIEAYDLPVHPIEVIAYISAVFTNSSSHHIAETIMKYIYIHLFQASTSVILFCTIIGVKSLLYLHFSLCV